MKPRSNSSTKPDPKHTDCRCFGTGFYQDDLFTAEVYCDCPAGDELKKTDELLAVVHES